jgi:phenylpropionate dioxygenase-like ring-hydroxylating dioxygenase large terminal subunit
VKTPQLNWDSWTEVPFPVATTKELKKKGMVAQEAMDNKLVVTWNEGQPRAFIDACAHLGLPLSMGKIDGNLLRCAYHSWAFDTDTGDVREQPTLAKPAKCSLTRVGCLVAGGLVFAWFGDPDASDLARSRLPSDVLADFSLHRVRFDSPFYLALFNAVDYAHFAEHRYYKEAYALYRRFRSDGHVPGRPFHWEVTGEDEAAVHLRLVEARRDLSMYATCADFADEGGVNRFQTFVTPLSATETLYWECYQARSSNPLVRLAAKALFHTVIVRLLDTEDSRWTGDAATNFLRGENIHMSETDAPLGAHLRKFVSPRQDPS